MAEAERDVTLVIPTYQSHGAVVKTVRRVLDDQALGFIREIIVVDDGGGDSTASAMAALCAADSRVAYLKLSRNFGQANAILCGLARGGGERFVVMDDDLEHDPAAISRLLSAIDEGYDYAFGITPAKSKGPLRRAALGARNLLMTGKKQLPHSSFIAMSAFARGEIVKYSGPFPYIASLLERASSSGVAVPVASGLAGDKSRTRYGTKNLARLWLNSFAGYSVRPLRLLSFVGAATALLGAAGALWWPFILAAIVFFSGVNILVLSVVGEYVGRAFMHVSEAPQYVVRDEKGFLGARHG